MWPGVAAVDDTTEMYRCSCGADVVVSEELAHRAHCPGYPVTWWTGEPSPAQEATAAHYRTEGRCPDRGACGHYCADGPCWRVSTCGPLSGVYPGNLWPDRILTANAVRVTPPKLMMAVHVVPGDEVLLDIDRGRHWLPVTSVSATPGVLRPLGVRYPSGTEHGVSPADVLGWRRGYEVGSPPPMEHPAPPVLPVWVPLECGHNVLVPGAEEHAAEHWCPAHGCLSPKIPRTATDGEPR